MSQRRLCQSEFLDEASNRISEGIDALNYPNTAPFGDMGD